MFGEILRAADRRSIKLELAEIEEFFLIFKDGQFCNFCFQAADVRCEETGGISSDQNRKIRPEMQITGQYGQIVQIFVKDLPVLPVSILKITEEIEKGSICGIRKQQGAAIGVVMTAFSAVTASASGNDQYMSRLSCTPGLPGYDPAIDENGTADRIVE